MRSLIIGLIVAAAFPAGALAAGSPRLPGRPLVPQGNSGADQYVESLPTAGGQRPTYSVNPTRPGSPGASAGLAPAVRRALARQGEAGRQTAGLARNYAPAKHRSAHRGSLGAVGGSSSSGTPSGGAATGQGPSAAAILVRSLTGFTSQGGLGAGLAVLLILTVLGAGGLAVARRRRAD
jgi:hypothetical protein